MRKPTTKIATAILITALTAVLVIEARTTEAASTAAVAEAASKAAGYIQGQTGENGMFVYRANFEPPVTTHTYNILRHAGTVYAMTMYYQVQPDNALKTAIERAAGYLRDNAIDAVPQNEHLLAVWSKPEVNQSNQPLKAKLGGTGLGLVALASVERLHPRFTPIDTLRRLGRFVAFMQKDDGSFYSFYIPSQGGRQDRWTSLYYPGEAALGLMMLYEIDPSPEWFKHAYKALTYLAESRKNQIDVPIDHWALLATAKLLSIQAPPGVEVSKDLLTDHAVQICRLIVGEQIVKAENPEIVGSFDPEAGTTKAATRLEGLQAALTFLPPMLELTSQIKRSVDLGIDFLLRAQLVDGPYAGGIPRFLSAANTKLSDQEQFNRRADEIRIDYVQHALSAMVQYLSKKEAN